MAILPTHEVATLRELDTPSPRKEIGQASAQRRGVQGTHCTLCHDCSPWVWDPHDSIMIPLLCLFRELCS